MDKEINEDARTKQDLLYECSSLESRLSDEIVKNEHLEQQCKKQKEVIDRIDKYIKPLITNRDDEQYYDINWYNKDVLLSMLKEVK